MALESTNQHWHYSSSGLEDVWRKDNISERSALARSEANDMSIVEWSAMARNEAV
jgi:hypothetical protein